MTMKLPSRYLPRWAIDVKFAIEEWLLKKTAAWRIKHSRFLTLDSMAYFDPDQMCWDDVDVRDSKGRWLPGLGFTVCSKKMWEYDNEINRSINEPEEPWRDITVGDGWISYYFKDDYLNSNHYLAAARKRLQSVLGDKALDKEIKLTLLVRSQKDINDELIQYAEWVKAGKPKFKVEFAPEAKESFKNILGDEEAQELFDRAEERNKEIDEEKNGEQPN